MVIFHVELDALNLDFFLFKTHVTAEKPAAPTYTCVTFFPCCKFAPQHIQPWWDPPQHLQHFSKHFMCAQSFDGYFAVAAVVALFSLDKI